MHKTLYAVAFFHFPVHWCVNRRDAGFVAPISGSGAGVSKVIACICGIGLCGSHLRIRRQPPVGFFIPVVQHFVVCGGALSLVEGQSGRELGHCTFPFGFWCVVVASRLGQTTCGERGNGARAGRSLSRMGRQYFGAAVLDAFVGAEIRVGFCGIFRDGFKPTAVALWMVNRALVAFGLAGFVGDRR